MVAPARVGAMARVASRGLAINVVFAVGVQALLLAQNIVVPRLLGPENIGVFALVLAVIGVGQQLKSLNVDEKLVQDRVTDLPLAYSNAFTLELLLASGLFVVTAAAAPVIAHLLDRPEMTWLIVALGLTIFTDALIGLPSAVYLRELRYFAQNLVQAAGTVVGVVVTVGAALAGAGVWSLVAGSLAGFVVSAVLMVTTMPFAPRLRLDGPIIREYVRYGWPLWTAGLLGVASTWGGSIVITSALGVVSLGYFTLASGIGRRVFQLDAVLAKTLFPVLTRAQGDDVGQRRAFETVTRLSTIWAAALGLGLTVYAHEAVLLILGEKWVPAVFLLRMQGVAVTLGSIGFSWDVFFRARGETRPTLVGHIIGEGWVFVILLPAVVLGGLTGAGWAILGLGAAALFVRQLYLQRIFPGINLLVVTWRELAATTAAAGGAWIAGDLVGRPSNVAELLLHGLGYVTLIGIGVGLLDGPFLTRLARTARGWSASAGVPVLATMKPAGIGGRVDDEGLVDLEVVDQDPIGRPAGPAARPTGQVAREDLRRWSTPGHHPLFATPGRDGRLWVTMRDSSLLGLFDPHSESWRTWRLPVWPHVACVDDRGRAWVALTLASQVVCVDPDGGPPVRHRVPRSRELLVAGWSDGSCWVADAGRKVLLSVDDTSVTSHPFPDAVLRPDFVVPGPDGGLWVTDTVHPALIRVAPDRSMQLTAVPDGTRVGVFDGPTLWVGHTSMHAASAIDTASGSVLTTVELPEVPFGLCMGPGRAVWFAFPHLDAVGRLDPDGTVTTLPTGEGTAPTSVAWIGETGYATCSGTAEMVQLT